MKRSFFGPQATLLIALLTLPFAISAQKFVTQKTNIGGDGGTDYLNVEPTSGRIFISRSTHVMVVDGATGKVVGDILQTPGVHGIAFAIKANHGFTTNSGDSSVTMFDLKTLAIIKRIATHTAGLDGIMYDDLTDRIVTINHSRSPAMGTVVAIDAKTGDIVGNAALTGSSPEGGASDGKGKLYINLEDKNSIDVMDARTLKVVATWSIAVCDGPTGIALDRTSNRIFAGCSGTSVVVDVATGKIVAQMANGEGVDALGWDPAQKLIYIPAGQAGNVTIIHQDSPDKYTTVATISTMNGAKTIAVDPTTHKAYVFTPEYSPAPVPAATPPAAGRGGRARGPMIGAWFISIIH